MLSQPNTKLTPAEYLANERVAEFKSEYLAGETFAMAGASRAHNRIATNLVRILDNQLIDGPCNVYASDMKVSVAQVDKYTYPDIVIACEKEAFEDEHTDVLLNPIVIMEILSESTEAYDRGKKFLHYQMIESLSEYLLISQDVRRVEKFVRQEDGTWIYSEAHELGDVITIDSAKCEMPMVEIYRKVL